MCYIYVKFVAVEVGEGSYTENAIHSSVPTHPVAFVNTHLLHVMPDMTGLTEIMTTPLQRLITTFSLLFGSFDNQLGQIGIDFVPTFRLVCTSLYQEIWWWLKCCHKVNFDLHWLIIK